MATKKLPYAERERIANLLLEEEPEDIDPTDKREVLLTLVMHFTGDSETEELVRDVLDVWLESVPISDEGEEGEEEDPLY